MVDIRFVSELDLVHILQPLAQAVSGFSFEPIPPRLDGASYRTLTSAMPNLTIKKRRRITDELLVRHMEGKLRRGAQAEVAQIVKSTRAAVCKIWKRYHETATNGISGGEWESRIKKISGRKPVSREEIAERLRAIPPDDRQNTRRAAEAAGISRNLVRSMLREGHLRRSSTCIKPQLSDNHKLARVEAVLSFVDDRTLQFELMENVVHIDEKWFNADKDKRSYLLLEGEAPPLRAVRNKNFIPKTMFLAAVARPRCEHAARGEQSHRPLIFFCGQV